MQTVENRKLLHATNQASREEGARCLHSKVGRPGMYHYRWTLGNCCAVNCPHASKDDAIAEDAFGKYVAIIRGRSEREPQQPVPLLQLADAQAELKHPQKKQDHLPT